MNRRQRSIELVGMMMGFCLLLAGCIPTDEPVRTELVPGTIHWVTWDTDSMIEAQLMQQFQEENPQIDFERSASYLPTEMIVSATPPPDLLNVGAD